MKKIILLLLVGVSFLSESNAQKCKYDFDKKDKFSGGRITGYKNPVKSGLSSKISLAMYLKGKKMIAEIIYLSAGELNETITEGHKINIRLEGDEVITLSSIGNASPVTEVQALNGSASVKTTYNILYDLDKSFLEKLSTKKPLAIQVEISDTGDFAKEFKDKKAVKLMDQARCLLSIYP